MRLYFSLPWRGVRPWSWDITCQLVVEVHEVVVDRVLRGVLLVFSKNALHVIWVAPATGRCVHARHVVQDERLWYTDIDH